MKHSIDTDSGTLPKIILSKWEPQKSAGMRSYSQEPIQIRQNASNVNGLFSGLSVSTKNDDRMRFEPPIDGLGQAQRRYGKNNQHGGGTLASIASQNLSK